MPARSERQQATVDAVLDAALDHLRSQGQDGLTVRAVAERAGVTHTTAYAYFTSRDHLVAELYWRQVRAEPSAPVDPGAAVGRRVAAALAGPGRVATSDPALARAGQGALFQGPLIEQDQLRAAERFIAFAARQDDARDTQSRQRNACRELAHTLFHRDVPRRIFGTICADIKAIRRKV